MTRGTLRAKLEEAILALVGPLPGVEERDRLAGLGLDLSGRTLVAAYCMEAAGLVPDAETLYAALYDVTTVGELLDVVERALPARTSPAKASSDEDEDDEA